MLIYHVQPSIYEAMQMESPRRFRAYGVGMAKTGTHALATIFSRFQSAHEVRHQALLASILDRSDGRITAEQQAMFLTQRDREFPLEMDVSQLNYFVLDNLLGLFPEAKFVLTIRDCYSWLDSLINHQLGRSTSEGWQRLRDLRFGGGQVSHGPGEAALQSRGLNSLDGYLAYWNAHNRKVLETVPQGRLLVIRTVELGISLLPLAKFLNVAPTRLESCSTHVFQAEKRFNVLAEIDRQLLADKIAEHCGPLMNEFFPEVQSLDAALARMSSATSKPGSAPLLKR